jgi:hypothetical protein
VQHDAPALPEFIVSELPNLPRYGDRKTLAPIITKFVFPVSQRSLEVWPLKWRRVNGHAVAETQEALALAWRKFNSAPVAMGGKGLRRPTCHSKPSHAGANRETAE